MLVNGRLPQRSQARRRPFAAAARGVAALAMFGLFASPSLAQGQEKYRIGPEDTLTVTVFEQPALSGRFGVSSSGEISFPLVGLIPVAGMTKQEVAERVRKSLGSRVPESFTLSVDVVEFAPVFVVGDVDKPGKFQFRPGMVALELMALGGGLKRVETPTREIPALQIIATNEALYGLRLQHFSQNIRRVRLLAELDAKPFDPPAPSPDERIELVTAQRVVENERRLHALRASTFEARQRGLDDQLAGYRNEIEMLTKAQALQAQEVSSLEQESDIAKTLTEQGMAARTRLLAVQRELSAMRRNGLELGSFLARAKQRLLEIDYQKAELRTARDTEIADSLRALDLEIAATEAKIAAASASLGALGQVEPSTPRDPGTVQLSVIREQNGELQEIPVGELAEIRPRDILRVTRQLATSLAGRT